MAFDAILGNEILKQRLTAAFENHKTSHCYLITGPIGSGKKTLAQMLIAALQCTGETKPCLRCSQCNKALSGNHPDVITIDEPDKATIPVKLVRESCADLYIRPNEGKKKIYLFPRAQALRAESQNTMLKCIEEPPSYGVFIFLCEHADRMLPTIRSRCVELRLSPLSKELLQSELRRKYPQVPQQTISAAILRSGGYLGQAMTILDEEDDALLPQTIEFVAAFCRADAAQLLRVLAPMEKLKREQLRPIFAQWYSILVGALTAHSAMPAMWSECDRIAQTRPLHSIMRATDAVKEAQKLLEANVGPAHICGALAVLLQS